MPRTRIEINGHFCVFMFVSNEAVSSLLTAAAACFNLGFAGSFAAVGSVSDLFYDYESCSEFDSSVAGSVVDSSDGSVYDSSSDLCDSCSAIFGFYLNCT